MGYPVFVVAIRPETNEVVLGNGQDVFTDVVRCNKLNWMALEGVGEEEISVNARSATVTKAHHVRSAGSEKTW